MRLSQMFLGLDGLPASIHLRRVLVAARYSLSGVTKSLLARVSHVLHELSMVRVGHRNARHDWR